MSNVDTDSTEVDIEERALEQYLESRLGSAAAFDVTPQEGGSGSSNETYFVQWDDREFVLRCAPDHERVPYLLHDVVEEYRILSELDAMAVPVPEPIAVCEDDGVLGTEFYVMESVAGDTLGGEELARFATPDRRHRVGEALIETLTSLHTLDADELDVRAVPEGTLEDAVEAHTETLEATLRVTERESELQRALEVGEWLRENVPESCERTLVHGDYKRDNIMFAPGPTPRVAAVLDWEMAGIGDTRADLGWFLAQWAQEKDPDPVTLEFEARYGDHPFYEPLTEDTSFMAHPDYPSRRELAARYEERTGIQYRHDRFYRALGLYKLTVICEKFHEAYLTVPEDAKETYPMMELLSPLLAERAALIADGDLPL